MHGRRGRASGRARPGPACVRPGAAPTAAAPRTPRREGRWPGSPGVGLLSHGQPACPAPPGRRKSPGPGVTARPHVTSCAARLSRFSTIAIDEHGEYPSGHTRWPFRPNWRGCTIMKQRRAGELLGRLRGDTFGAVGIRAGVDDLVLFLVVVGRGGDAVLEDRVQVRLDVVGVDVLVLVVVDVGRSLAAGGREPLPLPPPRRRRRPRRRRSPRRRAGRPRRRVSSSSSSSSSTSSSERPTRQELRPRRRRSHRPRSRRPFTPTGPGPAEVGPHHRHTRTPSQAARRRTLAQVPLSGVRDRPGGSSPASAGAGTP